MGSYTVLMAKLISKELLALRRRLSLTQEAMAEYPPAQEPFWMKETMRWSASLKMQSLRTQILG